MTSENIGLQSIILNEIKLEELSLPLFCHYIIHQHSVYVEIKSRDSIM